MSAPLSPMTAAMTRPHTLAERLDPAWKPYPYLQYVSTRVAQAIAKGNGRLIFNWPPGHGKTRFAGNMLPAWFFRWWPDERFLFVMHTTTAAQDEGRKARDLIAQNPWLGVRLMDAAATKGKGAQARGRWYTADGGMMASVGVGQGMYGLRGKVIVTDDLYPTWEAAQSPTYRKKVIDWWYGVLWNRRLPDATVILNMQRLHDEDICGHLIRESKEPWEVIRLPAIAEVDDVLGREPGELLCPERFGDDYIRSARSAPAPIFNAVYQQRPDKGGDGYAYPNFTDDNLDRSLKILPGLPLDVSIDFNRNPGMHVLLGQSDTMRGITWDCHEIHGPRMTLDGAMADLLKYIKGMNGNAPRRINVYGDASGRAEEMGDGTALYAKVEAWLERTGIPFVIHVPTHNPPIAERVIRVNDALCNIDGERTYFVHPDNCPRLVTDFRQLRVGPDGMPSKTDRALSHASDAIGYKLCELEKAAFFGTLQMGRPVFGR